MVAAVARRHSRCRVRHVSEFEADVFEGLRATPKHVPAKYFYDAAGSQLFERITELPEYYPTRCEISILRSQAADIAQADPAGRGPGGIRQRFKQKSADFAECCAEARGLCAGRYLRRDDRAGGGRAAAGFSRPQGAAGDGRYLQAIRVAGRGKGCRGRIGFFPGRPSAISSRTRPRRFCAMRRIFSVAARPLLSAPI